MTRAAIMKALTLRDRVTFGNSYLGPALKIGLVEMTQPDSPRSPTQRYRLTAWGQKAKAQKVVVEDVVLNPHRIPMKR